LILVDTNVLIDILSYDDDWYKWSRTQMETFAPQGLIINDIVYAELAPRYESEQALDEAIAELRLAFAHLPRAALYMAGRVHSAYRKRGGTRDSLLPDFFIGAHAVTARMPIITRDTRRYRAHFPDVKLIAPYQIVEVRQSD
jgi:predicted nucleic acid-binding protein